MSDQFKALIINQEGESFTREVKSIDKNFLKHGDVTVKVEYSGLNYKDALILKNGARLVKEFPHIPGIDFSGKVEESASEKFKPGDEVILTGWRVGEIYFGGYSQYAKVNGDFLVKKPKTLSLKESMIMGTAGFTALQCSFTTKTTREELLLGEKVKDVIVSGASGGVGSMAVMILNKLGCDVTAVTGKDNNKDYQWISTFPTDTPFFKKQILKDFHDKINLKNGKLFFIKSNNTRHNIFGLWSIDLADKLEKDLENGDRKVEDWANKVGVNIIDMQFEKNDPFFNINTKEDLEKAKKYIL